MLVDHLFTRHDKQVSDWSSLVQLQMAALNFDCIMGWDEGCGFSARAKDVAVLTTDLLYRLLTSTCLHTNPLCKLMVTPVYQSNIVFSHHECACC